MTTRQTSQALLLVIALLAGLGGFLFFEATRSGERDTGAGAMPAEPDFAAKPRGGEGPVALVAPAPLPAKAVARPTTVLWPLEVNLDLVEAAYLPEAEDSQPLGTGRGAILRGRVTDARGRGVPATVTFAEGPNAGRVLQADSEGRFGATDLYPGLVLLDVRGPGIVGSRRERRLRHGIEALLNLGYGLPASVSGDVLDVGGEPIAGAEVHFDGQVTYTDLEGRFYFTQVAAGLAVAEISKPGYASERQILNLTLGRSHPKLVFTLKAGLDLGLLVRGVGAGAGPVLVYLLPANPLEERKFPWYSLNPVEVIPGTMTTVRDLPEQHLHVRAFAPGAEMVRELRSTRVMPGPTRTLELEMRPTQELTGKVRLNGEPAAGARVSLEAPDRVQATASFFHEPTTYFESEIFPTFPPAFQEVVTGADGSFRFAAWEGLVATRYLTATGADGRSFAGRLVRSGDHELTLDLRAAAVGSARLELELPARTQGLACKLVINGAPRETETIAEDELLDISELVDGIWSLTVRWHGELLHEEPRLELRGRDERVIQLPEGAIVGQDREAWERAGRDYPL